MKIPTCGALRCANGTLRQVYCFLEISLGEESTSRLQFGCVVNITCFKSREPR
jgi:hypothetical protein